MWLTPTNGTSHVSASALAAETPTSSAPTSPGPTVHATARAPRRFDAGLDDRLGDDRVEQIEVGAAGDLGTTPPYWACRSTWVETTLDSTSSPSTHHRRGGLVAARLDAEDRPRDPEPERHEPRTHRASSTTVRPGRRPRCREAGPVGLAVDVVAHITDGVLVGLA